MEIILDVGNKKTAVWPGKMNELVCENKYVNSLQRNIFRLEITIFAEYLFDL